MNKNLYDNFSPDWTSPVGDTIKDILEERGEDYDSFVYKVAEESGWSESTSIYDMFDGKESLILRVANILSKELGSTPYFWMRRSQQNHIEQPMSNSYSATFTPAEINEITHILASTLSGGVRFNRDQLDMANQRISNLEEGIQRSLELFYEKLGTFND